MITLQSPRQPALSEYVVLVLFGAGAFYLTNVIVAFEAVLLQQLSSIRSIRTSPAAFGAVLHFPMLNVPLLVCFYVASRLAFSWIRATPLTFCLLLTPWLVQNLFFASSIQGGLIEGVLWQFSSPQSAMSQLLAPLATWLGLLHAKQQSHWHSRAA